jgi:hypothetical protein
MRKKIMPARRAPDRLCQTGGFPVKTVLTTPIAATEITSTSGSRKVSISIKVKAVRRDRKIKSSNKPNMLLSGRKTAAQANRIPVKNSTAGYLGEIFRLHLPHFPRRNK